MYQIAIITTWHEEWYGSSQQTDFKFVDSLEEPTLEQAGFEVSYGIANDHFEYDEGYGDGKDFVFAEDKRRGYTQHSCRIYIDHQTIICNNPETNQLQTIHTRDGECHDCWTKPEEDA